MCNGYFPESTTFFSTMVVDAIMVHGCVGSPSAGAIAEPMGRGES